MTSIEKEITSQAILYDDSFTAEEKLYKIFDIYRNDIPHNLRYAILEWKDKNIKDLRRVL